ncbi:RNA methyltransferase [Zhouia spongiae]|uniref:RNA methyltransferase n=1 Tax=Zhouia spongiae TaxID=2202721 RepID=A0ABY3YHB5_9FLAO|nr:RNA methyltransferase [Zhouia spongiae]UNY97321.1 RNA methyltransferase [Zhouia spongiae]
MVTKNEIKLVKSLQQKKYRTLHGLFAVEGIKAVNEFLNSDFKLKKLFVTDENLLQADKEKVTVVKNTDLVKMSMLKNPNKALALFEIRADTGLVADEGLVVALDDVRDPGNLGTIIRLCDWFGIKTLICSENTVDCYNSKVVQATMGSLTRVKIIYTDLVKYIEKSALPVYVADMGGDNVYTAVLPEGGVLVMGNEANGVSDAVMKTVTNTIAIPQFGSFQETESLNVATATAILLSEFKRRV